MFNALMFSKYFRLTLSAIAMTACVCAQESPFGATPRTSSRNPFKDDSGSKPTETNDYVFDVSRVNASRTLETPARFAKIWAAFRTQHALGSDGEFVREAAATTPDNAETQAAFLRYVAANSPVVRLESEQKCKACTNGRKPATDGLKVVEVECNKCEGRGVLWVVDNYQLTYTGVVPAKPAPKVTAPSPAVAKTAEARPVPAPGSRADEYRMLADRIMVLGKRFKIDRDEFTNELSYVPLSERNNLHLNPVLPLTVHDDGRITLFTRHRGSEWLFHDRFSIKVGERGFDSSKIPSARRMTKVMDSGAVLELCSYPESDHEALEAIAKTPEARVLLRIYGSAGIDTRELEKEEKNGIRDAMELSAILKKIYKMRKEDGIKGKIGDDSK